MDENYKEAFLESYEIFGKENVFVISNMGDT